MGWCVASLYSVWVDRWGGIEQRKKKEEKDEDHGAFLMAF